MCLTRILDRRVIGLLAAMIAAAPVAAQTPPVADDASPLERIRRPGSHIQFLPGVWIPRLNGDARLAPGLDINLHEQLDVDDIEATPYADLSLRMGERWLARGSGFQFETSASGVFEDSAVFGNVQLEDGDRYQATLDITSFGFEAVYLGRELIQQPTRAALRFRPYVGARSIRVDQTLEEIGLSRQEAKGEWLGVYAGLDVALWTGPEQRVVLGRAVGIEIGGGVGTLLGGDGGFMWQIRGNIALDLAPSAGLVVGYRLLEVYGDDGAYTFEAGLQGMFFGVSVRF